MVVKEMGKRELVGYRERGGFGGRKEGEVCGSSYTYLFYVFIVYFARYTLFYIHIIRGQRVRLPIAWLHTSNSIIILLQGRPLIYALGTLFPLSAIEKPFLEAIRYV